MKMEDFVMHCSYCSKSVEIPLDQSVTYHICGHIVARIDADSFYGSRPAERSP